MSTSAHASSKSKWPARAWIAVGIYTAVAVVFSLSFLRLCVIRPFQVPTGAMRPTIRGQEVLPDGTRTVGDHIFVNLLLYRLHEPRRGDVVVFRTTDIDFPRVKRNDFYVKRIAAIPGDVVSIRPPALMVNGTVLREPEFFDWMARQTNGYEGYFRPQSAGSGTSQPLLTPSGEMKLKAGEYLVLGDNSRSSLDGRYFGPIRRKAIVGKVTWIYFPFDRMGPVK